jgi:hypothetical protein
MVSLHVCVVRNTLGTHVCTYGIFACMYAWCPCMYVSSMCVCISIHMYVCTGDMNICCDTCLHACMCVCVYGTHEYMFVAVLHAGGMSMYVRR